MLRHLHDMREQVIREAGDEQQIEDALAEIEAAIREMSPPAPPAPPAPIDIDAVDVDETNYEAVLAWAERRTAVPAVPAVPRWKTAAICAGLACVAVSVYAALSILSVFLPSFGYYHATVEQHDPAIEWCVYNPTDTHYALVNGITLPPKATLSLRHKPISIVSAKRGESFGVEVFNSSTGENQRWIQGVR